MLKNKKIWLIISLIFILVIVAGSTMFYFYRQTPRYTFILIKDAIEDHDVAAFKRHVDTEKLLSSAYDDLVLSGAIGEPNEMMKGIATMVKPAVIPVLEWQIRLFVEHGKSDFTDSKMQAESKTADVFKKELNLSDIEFKKVLSTVEEDGKAKVTLLLFDKKLKQEFNLDLAMEQLEDKTWRVLRVLNLPDYLQALKEARTAKLNELNKPISENIASQIHFTMKKLDFRKVNIFLYTGDMDVTLGMNVHAPKTISTVMLDYHLVTKDGLELFIPFTVNVNMAKGEKDITLTKTLSRLIDKENALLKTDPQSITASLNVKALYYQDGAKIELLKELP